jgi:aryl-alcohol dehydrogenase-like predicted oxidoreductase
MTTPPQMQTRPIPKTGEALPVIGLGTWQSFDVGRDAAARSARMSVLQALFDSGASVIDSSPMYGRSEGVVGDLLDAMHARDRAFLATKVWIRGERAGIDQMNESFRLFRTDVIDLMQIHNLVDWRTQLRTIRAWQDAGRFRYVGITHYTAGAFDELAAVMRTEAIDFVQLPYSIALREAERTLLPLAADRGIAVIVNRPFEGGGLFGHLRQAPLPAQIRATGIESWAQLFLAYVLAEPAVTCVIPGTANPSHLADNLAAGSGPTLDPRMRAELIRAAGAD